MASLQDSDPRQVAAYRLIERLGMGGMGITYLAESPSGRMVAVKVVRPDLAGDPEFRARFRREVAAAHLAGGYHTAAVVDADPDANPPWMATQYIPGPSLDAKVRRDGPLDPVAMHRLAAALAESLHAFHSAGLIHRDLKPDNIIMADDGPRIIDFGIAITAGARSGPRLTATGTVIGTLAFLSPEQLGESPVGPPSDIFSLGSVLAFAAMGRVPFEGRDFAATSYAIVNKAPNLRALAGPLRDIVAACLAKDPARRPTAADLLSSLYATRPPAVPFPVAAGPAVITPPEPAPPPAPNPATAIRGAMALSPARPVRAAIRRRTLTRAAQSQHGTAARPATSLAVLPQSEPPRLQVRPMRHGWRLVTVGQDGRWLASANGDGIITAWLAESGLPVRTWPAGARVRAMAAGPGDLLVAATEDGRVRAWDVADGTARRYLPDVVRGLTGTDQRVRCLALDPSGGWLAASVAGRVLLWDVTDPAEPQIAAGLPCPAEVTALAFDDTARLLATGDRAGKVRVWNFARLAAAAPDGFPPGSALNAAPMETAWVDPPGTLAEASRPNSGPVLTLAWDGAHECWLAAGPTGPHGWLDADTAEGDAAETIGIGGVRLRAAAVSPGGRFVVMIDELRGRLHLAGLDDLAQPRMLDGAELAVTGVAFTASGMLAVGGSDGSLRIWDATKRATRALTTAGSPVTAVAAAPDGTRLVVGRRNAELRSFGPVNGALMSGWGGNSPGPSESLVFRADGKRLAIAGDAVRLWDAADGSPSGALPGRTGWVRALAADREGRRIAAAWAEAVVTVWDGTRLLWELTGHRGAVLAVAFGPRPGLLVSAGDDQTIRTWDLAKGREIACHAAPGYRATVLAASHSGETLAAGCADGTVRLFQAARSGELPDWAEAPTLDGHAHGITALSFDGADRLLATASRDGTARVWDLETRLTTTVILPGSAAAVVSGDGTWLGLGETEGFIWQAAGLTRVPIPFLEAVT